MQQDTLAEILGVEKEIRDKLDAEREQASKWLEHARREIEQAHLAAMAGLQESCGQDAEAAKRAAHPQAATVIRQAETSARPIDRFHDDDLRQLIRRHIAVIVPGGGS